MIRDLILTEAARSGLPLRDYLACRFPNSKLAETILKLIAQEIIMAETKCPHCGTLFKHEGVKAPPDPRFTPLEAADYCRVSRSTIYANLDALKITHYRLSATPGRAGKIVIPKSALDRWMNENLVEAERAYGAGCCDELRDD